MKRDLITITVGVSSGVLAYRHKDGVYIPTYTTPDNARCIVYHPSSKMYYTIGGHNRSILGDLSMYTGPLLLAPKIDLWLMPCRHGIRVIQQLPYVLDNGESAFVVCSWGNMYGWLPHRSLI